MIVLEPQVQKIIIEDAVEAFPDECCGFVFGHEDNNGRRFITEARVVKNVKEGDRRRRFEIAPKDYLDAEKYAEEKQIELLGVYHSHPNHPAVPSEHDRAAAQPFFSYLIISVNDKVPGPIRSWRLNDDWQFEEENNHLITF
ncbi:M67 family metallopeptidase [Niastella caeni]|uniref:M67 family metallopeptidase n=1 Tax=Niastella caeni TaxID=2569763 RepID=A0A4S8HYY0_9BACT|nr:M67 family metallopeptidase [Niastella caeni]THU40957.1 M67 family metallopeptidase [Niastella caeni]